MIKTPMYPLRFEPIYQYRLWGGRNLSAFLTAPLPGDGPIGEAWLLSDRDDHLSKVADGPLKGSTIRQLLEELPDPVAGKTGGSFPTVPRAPQVPRRTRQALGPGASRGRAERLDPGRRERQDRSMGRAGGGAGEQDLRGAETGHDSSRFGAGSGESLRGGVPTKLHAEGRRRRLPPSPDRSLSQRPRGVRSAGKQRRHVSPLRLGSRRPQDGQASTPASRAGDGLYRFRANRDRPGGAGGGGGVTGTARASLSLRTLLGVAAHGRVAVRGRGDGPPRVLVCVVGEGDLEHRGADYPIRRGDVVLLPAEVGACRFRPANAVTMLEVALPE